MPQVLPHVDEASLTSQTKTIGKERRDLWSSRLKTDVISMLRRGSESIAHKIPFPDIPPAKCI
jgi:SET domain-containing protein